jgi:hypothetical protein
MHLVEWWVAWMRTGMVEGDTAARITILCLRGIPYSALEVNRVK